MIMHHHKGLDPKPYIMQLDISRLSAYSLEFRARGLQLSRFQFQSSAPSLGPRCR